MSNLQSALEEIQGTDPDRIDEAALADGYAELERAADVVLSERLKWLAAIERRGTYARDGHVSLTAWLAGRFRKTWSAASRLVRAARALEQMPSTREALESGEITSSAVDVLLPAREVDPQAFAQAEAYLVQAATTLSIPDLRGAVATWRRAAEDAQGIEFPERAYERRRLHVSPTLAGMVRVDGDLDPETGQTVISALRAVCDAQVRSHGDLRTPPQRRPMRWGRSAGSGWTQTIAPSWEASALTSPSPWTCRPWRDACLLPTRPVPAPLDSAREQSSRTWVPSLRRPPGVWPATHP